MSKPKIEVNYYEAPGQNYQQPSNNCQQQPNQNQNPLAGISSNVMLIPLGFLFLLFFTVSSVCYSPSCLVYSLVPHSHSKSP